MNLQLYNTLTKQKEVFKPIKKDKVGMYVCGPTVYDYAHIGNARAMVVFDVLYRLLCELYSDVIYVRNITDVDDKINAAAKEQGIPISELTLKTTEHFHEDMASLNCLPPSKEPNATTHIPDMLKMIKRLIKRGHAYESNNHVYFSVESDPTYGRLSGRTIDDMIAGSRVEVSDNKRHPGDFVLWKPSADDEPGWNSSWGRGRPGWHIECSAMSYRYLGKTFDIHGGGADLQFPHHENEISQTCCAYEHAEFARYWVHNGFLTVEGEKMSKSLGNFVTVHTLLERGVRGEILRYLLLSTHYRKPLDFSEKALQDATKSMNKFYKCLVNNKYIHDPQQIFDEDTELKIFFEEILCDDLNTPNLLSALHGFVDAENANALYACGKMLGFFEHAPDGWFSMPEKHVDRDYIEAQVSARQAAKDAREWEEADRIRDELKKIGVLLEDYPDGTTNWRVE